MTLSLGERLLAIHHALTAARLPHAFGGAIALAFYTQEPRGTRDLDLNVFVDQTAAAEALAAFPAGVGRPPAAVAAIVRDGQGRLWWDGVPVDVFFDTVEFHRQAQRNTRTGTFLGVEIPVLGPVELAVFKAVFDRTKDWADIEAMVTAESLDINEVVAALRRLVGAEDPRIARFDEAVRRGMEERDPGAA